MKLLVGLGNPGTKYEHTRHNIGFKIIDQFLEKNSISKLKEGFSGLYEILNFNGQKVLILKPSTFMNLSGDSVRQVTSYYKIQTSDVLIIHDDKDLELGRIKYQIGGSSGGQNGVKDVISKLATESFNRLRVGIGNSETKSTIDYVLDNFSSKELKNINFNEILSSLEDFISKDMIYIMNKYN